MNKIKRFFSYYGPHRLLFWIDLAAAFLMSGIDLVFPMVTRRVINDFIPNKVLDQILKFALFMLILYLVKMVLNYIVVYWGHSVGVRMEYHMRKDIFAHVQTLSFSYFDKVRTGKIMSRIVNDLREVTELAHHGPEDLFISMVTLIGSFILLLTVDWRLSLIIFSFMPFIVWFGISRRKKLSKAFKASKKSIAEVNAQLENSISGIRVAQSFCNETFEMEKFDQGNVHFKKSREMAFQAMGEMIAGINFLSNFLKVLVLSLGGYWVYQNSMTGGDLVAFLLYIELFFQPIRRLMEFTQQYEEGMAGFERFCEIMDIEPEIKSDKNAVSLDQVQGEIRLNQVSFSYKEGENVLSHLDLVIPKGKTVALVGPSGGGKTTICHLIPRFYDVKEGSVEIDGIDVRQIELSSLRKNIGFVQQDVFLFAGTIKDNILYGRGDATMEEVVEAAKKANIHDFIASLEAGYDTYVGERGVQLSGGQKQRISIARVFLKDPSILILDEATSALDNETELKIQKALEALSKGRTSIIIAHRLSTIKNADEIVVIDKEGIIERGTHEALIERDGHYAKLYRAQFKGYIPDDLVVGA